MSSACGNCDCADKSQCPKKGKAFSAEIVQSNETVSFDYEMAALGGENDCKCGPGCKCKGCTCGH